MGNILITNEVIIRWNPKNRKWYEDKGYIFTKWKDEFIVKVKDLPNGSDIGVSIECDNIDCKNPILKEIRWVDYKKYVKEDGKYYCNKCAKKLFGTENAVKTIINKNKIRAEGESNVNGSGSRMTIIEYINSKNVIVQFENGYIRTCLYGNFKKGNVKNPTEAKIDIDNAYIGEGSYRVTFNRTATPIYSVWHGMLIRCYDDKYQLKQPTYIGCTVCEEWHNFQNFAKWYDENYYEIQGSKMQLDKDILVKGNKVYSPETCCIVPQNINNLFTKRHLKRGSLPIGVNLHNNQYGASCREGTGIRIHLGLYPTPELAFEAYKTYKENLIKEIAEKYHGLIPEKVYNSLMQYKVEITD